MDFFPPASPAGARPPGQIIMEIIKVLCRGALPPEPPVPPASRPATNSLSTHYKLIINSLRSGGAPAPPEPPPFAPADRPVIASIIKGEKIIKGGGGPRPPPLTSPRTSPFAPAYRPVIGSIIKGKKLIKVGGAPAPPRTPLLGYPSSYSNNYKVITTGHDIYWEATLVLYIN